MSAFRRALTSRYRHGMPAEAASKMPAYNYYAGRELLAQLLAIIVPSPHRRFISFTSSRRFHLMPIFMARKWPQPGGSRSTQFLAIFRSGQASRAIYSHITISSHAFIITLVIMGRSR